MHSYCNKLNSMCVNTAGSFECKCKVGFRNELANRSQSAEPICVDINECTEQSIVCGREEANTRCINSFGSYECKCTSGYEWSPSAKACLDVNECALSATGIPLPDGRPECDEHSVCVNNIGSFQCLCKAGWSNHPESNYCSGFFF
jgi:hypothetical protein